MVEMIDCSGFGATPTILGSSSYEEIVAGTTTDFEDQYFNNGIFVGLSTMQTPGYYYYGVKYESAPALNYSMQAYHYTQAEIPHQEWALPSSKVK